MKNEMAFILVAIFCSHRRVCFPSMAIPRAELYRFTAVGASVAYLYSLLSPCQQQSCRSLSGNSTLWPENNPDRKWDHCCMHWLGWHIQQVKWCNQWNYWLHTTGQESHAAVWNISYYTATTVHASIVLVCCICRESTSACVTWGIKV